FVYAFVRAAGVKHGNRAGLECGINGENAHKPILTLFLIVTGLGPAIHAFTWAVERLDARFPGYIGRTSTTSGTKCRTRFRMPCLSGAVEEGQPEQAPFILRKTTPSL